MRPKVVVAIIAWVVTENQIIFDPDTQGEDPKGTGGDGTDDRQNPS